MYEYIKRSEYSEPIQKCLGIIRDVQKDLKNNFNIQIHLIGSCKSRLMTKNGNGPYDFDYSLEIVKNKNNIKDPEEIRKKFFNSFQKFANNHGFHKMNNGSRVIELKSYSTEINNHISFILQVAIIQKIEDVMNIIKFDKENNIFIWNQEEDHSELNKRFRKLRKICWLNFKDKYLKKKNYYLTKNEKRKSISIFKETIEELE